MTARSLLLPLFIPEASSSLYSASHLQRLTDCVRCHPDWSLAHVAVHLDLAGLVGQPRFRRDVSLADSRGCTPLMLAVQTGSRQTVTAVLAAGADIGSCDKEGNNVFHMAAVANKDVIDLISQKEKVYYFWD